jgi:hypothetical protein
MRNGIREFQPRQPLDRQLGATTLNQILRELESLRITRVVNGTFRKLPGGTEITVAPQRGGGTSTPTTHPFQIFSRQDPESDPENPTYLVTVRPGTINALLPSDIFDGSGLKEHELSEDTMRYVVLEANSDGQQINAASILLETEAPEPQSPEIFGLPATAKFLLGIVYNFSVYQVVFTNISVTGKQQFVASKTSPAAPGELPYEIYYVWG